MIACNIDCPWLFVYWLFVDWTDHLFYAAKIYLVFFSNSTWWLYYNVHSIFGILSSTIRYKGIRI